MKKVPEKYIINDVVVIKIQSILKIAFGLLIFSNREIREYEIIISAHNPVVIESKLVLEIVRFS